VPKSDVPKEETSPTQPFPVKPEPLVQISASRSNLYKGEPQHQSYCEHMVDDNNMKLGGPFMPIAGWRDLVDQMASKGADATDAEFSQIVDYLATAFPPVK